MNATTRIAIGLLAAILLALLVGPYLIDWNRYKPELESWLTARSGHHVTVAGDLRVRLLPGPRLSMAEVAVAEAADAQAPLLLSLSQLDLRAAFWPLLTGRIVVSSLMLDKPVLDLKRKADGRFNLGAVEGADRRKVVRAGFVLAPQDVAIDQIEIADGTLNYQDELLNWHETVRDIAAMVQAQDQPGAYRGNVSFDWTGRRLTLDADLKPRDGNGVSPLIAILENKALGLKATLTGRFTGAHAGWQIGGALALRVDAPSALGTTVAGGNAMLPLVLDGALLANAKTAGVRDWALRWGDFAAQGTALADYAGDPKFTLKATGTLLNLDALRPEWAAMSRTPYWPLGLLGLAADVKPAEPVPTARGLAEIWQGALDLKLDALVFAQGRINAPSLNATYNHGLLEITDLTGILPGDTELHVSGTRNADGRFAGKAALAGEGARELLSWAGVPVAGIAEGRLMRIAYLGGVKLGDGTVSFNDIQAGLDGSQVKGSLTLARPAAGGTEIAADLAFTRLNCEPYAPLFGADAAPLHTLLSLLDETTGTLKLAAETVVVDGADAHGLTADLVSNAGAGTTIQSLKFDDLLGAQLSLTGSAKAAASAATLALSGDAVGLDLRPLLSRFDLAVAEGLAPIGPASIDLKAELVDGTGTVTAEGYLSTGKIKAALVLDKAEAPLLGRLGAGSAETTLALDAPDIVVLGRLLGFDPPLAPKPGDRTAVEAEMARLGAERTAKRQPLALGQAMLRETRKPGRYALTALAGLGSGEAALAVLREGEGEDGRAELLLDASAADTPALLNALGVSEAKRNLLPGPLSVALKAVGPAKAVAVTPLLAEIGPMKLDGEGQMDLSGARPLVSAKLHGSVLDLDALGAVLPHVPHPEDVPGPWSERPLDLSGLGSIDARFDLEADGISLGRLPFTYPKFKLALQDGTLTLSDLRATLFGGPMTANIALRGGTVLPGIAVSAKFIQLDGGALVKRIWGGDVLQGSFGGALTLTAQGTSTAALASSAAGSLTLKSPAGTITGIDPKNQGAVTAFTDLAVEAGIENGLAQLKDSHMRSADGVVPFSGGAALAPFTLNLTVAPPGKPGVVVLDGPLDAPKRKVQ